ncbi:MAG: hypothetical protein IJH61_02110 [Eubacteriaceae bacterium]|nr:hypothetical protein [Eubacteriaceae bacterium]
MSQPSRNQRKQVNRRRLPRIGLAFFFIILVLGGFLYNQYRRGAKAMVSAETYHYSIGARLYLFKTVDYVVVDGLSGIKNVKNGTKVNGYSPLTKSPGVVNTNYLQNQIDTLAKMETDQTYNHRRETAESVIDRLGSLTRKKGQDTSFNDDTFKQNVSRYLPYDAKEIAAKRDQLGKLNDGKARQIVLHDLGMQASGFYYDSISGYDKVVNVNLLPYLSMNFLRQLNTTDRSTEAAVCIVSNDSIYAAFDIGSSETLISEGDVKALKKSYFGDDTNQKSEEYYKFLSERADMIYQYPEVTLHKNGKEYKAYLVDIVQDGSARIGVVVIKDYLEDFASENVFNGNVDIDNYRVYRIPRTAVYERGDKSYIHVIEKDFFDREQEIHIKKTDGNDVLLEPGDNPDLPAGTPYRLFV